MSGHDETIDRHSTDSNAMEEDADEFVCEPIKQANTSVNQDYSKHYVRLTIKIPEMKTGLNWRRMTREAINGLTTKATYHGTRVYFEFILNHKESSEMKYEYSSREPFRGPIEYKRSFLKYKDGCVTWFVHKSLPW